LLNGERTVASVRRLQFMRVSGVSLVILVIAFFLGGCHQRSTPVSLPEITSESEEGFHDLVFAIEDHKKLSDGSQTILGSGMYKGKKVSLEIYLGAAWRSGVLDADIPLTTYRGTVSYRSVGAESDLLLQVMDELYETKQAPKAMNKTTEFTALSLGGDPSDLVKEPVKFKLFFESNAEDQYAELFTNIDLKARKLYIGEKDEDYRAAIVHALRTP
jgi:hypothetical protein